MPAPVVRLGSGEIFARILQHEDSRWIGTDNFLMEQTRSRNASIKMRAMLALGRIGDPQGLPWLFDRLADSSPSLRARALFAIGQIIDLSNLEHEGHELRPEWLSPIVKRLSDSDPTVRARAVEALGKSADKTHADRIIALIVKDPNMAVVTRGLMALDRMGDPSHIDRVLSLKSHSSPEVRWRLAAVIDRLRNANAALELKSLLRDGDPQVRAQGARAYGRAGNAAVSALVPLLKDPHLKVRIEAARGLGLTHSITAVPPLLGIIRQHSASIADEEEHVVTAATESWGNLRPVTGMEIISKLAKQHRPAAAAAVVALAKARKGDETFPDEIEIDTDPFWLQRSKIQALGENGSRAALQKLLSLATQADPTSRLLLPWCLDAMVQMGRAIHPEAFWRHLSDEDPTLRAHAIQALTALRRPREPQPWTQEAAESVMRSYFAYQSEKVIDPRLAAAEFMSTLDAPTAVAALERIARDSDRNVRLKARNLLQSRFEGAASGIAGLVNTGRNHSFYVNALNTVKRYAGARFLTDRGNWTIRFFGSDAPLTVYNFIVLAQNGFFNNLTFARVVPDIVIQGGDPRNDTRGGPGYAIRSEVNERPFLRGTVGMALSGKDSGGSQFFICLSPQPQLEGGYTAFAEVYDGTSVVDRILLGDHIRKVELLSQISSRAETVEGRMKPKKTSVAKNP